MLHAHYEENLISAFSFKHFVIQILCLIVAYKFDISGNVQTLATLFVSNVSFARDDVTKAMKLFQDAKEQDLFPTHSVCLQLLNCMARSDQTEHFESGTYVVRVCIK